MSVADKRGIEHAVCPATQNGLDFAQHGIPVLDFLFAQAPANDECVLKKLVKLVLHDEPEWPVTVFQVLALRPLAQGFP